MLINKRMSLLLGNTLKNLDVKGHHTYNLFSNNLEKKVHICLSVCVSVYIQRERKRKDKTRFRKSR